MTTKPPPLRLHVGQGTTRGPLTVSPASARGFAERVESTPVMHTRSAGLGARWQGGGRIRVDDVRWSDRTVHLSAVDLTHSLQEA